MWSIGSRKRLLKVLTLNAFHCIQAASRTPPLPKQMAVTDVKISNSWKKVLLPLTLMLWKSKHACNVFTRVTVFSFESRRAVIVVSDDLASLVKNHLLLCTCPIPALTVYTYYLIMALLRAQKSTTFSFCPL